MQEQYQNLSILEEAALSVKSKSTQRPSPSELVEALLEAEKAAKKSKTRYNFDRLLGTWQLCFITGTKKTRQRAGIVLGSGQYIPRFVNIQLSYSSECLTTGIPTEVGSVENTVGLGGLKLSLTGPTKFLPQKNILAFDFTRMTVRFFGVKLYDGYIRGGEAKEAQFYAESVGKQAFFAYFFMGDDAIAARGRGGGLALWVSH